MNKQTEALKLALEALESVKHKIDSYQVNVCDDVDEAITAVREALADSALERMAENARELGLDYEAAQQQEPVAVYVGETWCGSVVRLYEDLPLETPLYTSPPASKPWVGLTDEEIQTIWRSSEHMTVNQVCRAIEAKLREKNA